MADETPTPSRFQGLTALLDVEASRPRPAYYQLVDLVIYFLAYRGLAPLPEDVTKTVGQVRWFLSVMHLNDQRCAGDFFYLLDQLGIVYK